MKLGALPMTRFPSPSRQPEHRYPPRRPSLFFRVNAAGTIPFQLSLRINPLFDVSRLLAIKRANGTRWRVAPYGGRECDGRRWLHKQQDGRRRGFSGAPSPSSSSSATFSSSSSSYSRGGCAATPAWPADERVVLRKERTRARTLSILSECLAV